MKKYKIIFQISLALFVFANSVYAQEQSLKLWYNQPAQKWTDALPIGNGNLGAMVYGGIQEEQVQFNESTLWTGRPRDYQRNGAYQYLDSIRQLLFKGKQVAAEALAEKHFMGLKDVNDSVYAVRKKEWQQLVTLDKSLAAIDVDDTHWPTMQLPTLNGWEQTGLEGLDGAVWFRTSFDLPKEWLGKNIKIDLGRIRDLDFCYVNGVMIGSTESNTNKRSYTINAAVLKEGKNTLAIQVLNFFDKGGFSGIKENRKIFVIYPALESADKGLPLNTRWKYFVQNNNPPQYPQYQASYQPFGDVFFTFDSLQSIRNYKRSLDIKNAISTVSYTSAGTDFTRTYFASNPQNAVVMHFAANKNNAINCSAFFKSVHSIYTVKKIDDHTLSLQVQVKNGALKGVAFLYIKNEGGTVSVNKNRLVLKNVTTADFYLVAATNFKNFKIVDADAAAKCASLLHQIKQKKYVQIKAAHINDYQKLFTTFSVNFGADTYNKLPTDERIKNFSAQRDPAFLALYMQYARYLLIACSRQNSEQPSNLQGIWNNLLTPPWGSKFTTNINAEMNYWPAEILNLSVCTSPFFNKIQELAITGEQTAKQHYGARGWVVHHNTDIWNATAPINAANHGIWVSGGAWMSLPIWEHFLFTQDTAFLKKYYPILQSAALFFADFLIPDPVSGKLISTPGNSPENGGLVAGPTMDHQIIRELFKNTISASKIINTDAPFSNSLQKLYTSIAPNTIGRYGQLQEWLRDEDDTANKHRHVSHLWGVYPGTDITWNNPEMMKAARQSLIYRGDEGTGWSLAWKVNLWARFKEGNHAMSLAEKLLSPADDDNGISEKGGVYKNMFDAHPPFQIDGNFGGAAGIAEMLVQSHSNYIELLPALPNDLNNGEVKGLCARGGFEINMHWRNQQLETLTITSINGNECRLQYGTQQIKFATKKGQTYQLNKTLQLL